MENKIMYQDGWFENDYEHGDEIYQVDFVAVLGNNNCVNYVFTFDLEDGHVFGAVYP